MIEFHKKLCETIVVEHKYYNNILLNRRIFISYQVSKKERKLSKISNAEVLFIGYLAVSDFKWKLLLKLTNTQLVWGGSVQ